MSVLARGGGEGCERERKREGGSKRILSYSNKSGHRINTGRIGRDGKENGRY